jgi:hypothetical protein
MPHQRFVVATCEGTPQPLGCGCSECPECDVFLVSMSCKLEVGHTITVEM